MPPHEPRSGPPRLGISFNQLVGSALAAAAAAFGASFLGVAGTIIGAAVASVIATVASAMYSRSLQRTREVVQTTVTQWSRTAADAPVVDPGAPDPPPRRRPVLRLAGAGLAVMALTFGSLTGVEAVLGRPIAALLGGSHESGTTTLGSVAGPDAPAPAPRPHRSRTPTPDPTPATSPSATPTSGPTAGTTATPAPSPTPVETPTPDPTPSPTGTPSG